MGFNWTVIFTLVFTNACDLLMIAANPTNYDRYLERSSVIFALTRLYNATGEVCYSQLQQVQRGILQKDPWAMKVLDSSGSKPSGFMFGHNYWLGSRETCEAVQNPIDLTLSKDFERLMHDGIINEMAPFDMEYRVVYLEHNSPWQLEMKLKVEQIILIGLCVPSSCTSTEIKRLMSDYIDSEFSMELDIYEMKPQVVHIKDLKLGDSFYQRKSLKILGGFMIFTVVMMVCASLLPVESTKSTSANQIEAVAKTSQESTVSNGVNGAVKVHADLYTKLKNFVRCFDVNMNCKKMFSTSQASTASDIPVLNGLRSLSAFWILSYHVWYCMYYTVNNKPFLMAFVEKMLLAPMFVNIFFTISAFLQTNNFLCNTVQLQTIRRNSFIQNTIQFTKMMFHRYLRLAPLYLVIIGLTDLLYAYMVDVSVYHVIQRYDVMCPKYWWRNVLFIHNFFDLNEICGDWTWSLACEMEYFTLASILLIIYVKHPKFVKSTVLLIALGNVCWSLYIGVALKFKLSFDSVLATGTEIYISPFVRVMPYILGAIAAWYHVERRTEFKVSQSNESFIWNLRLLIFFSCLSPVVKYDLSYFWTISLFVFGFFIFSLNSCALIVSSARGRCCWWSRILEAKVFRHVSRVTYAVYLLNPVVITAFFSLTNASTHLEPIMMWVLACGFAVITYLLSIIFSLAFEMPYCNWSSLMMKHNKTK